MPLSTAGSLPCTRGSPCTWSSARMVSLLIVSSIRRSFLARSPPIRAVRFDLEKTELRRQRQRPIFDPVQRERVPIGGNLFEGDLLVLRRLSRAGDARP